MGKTLSKQQHPPSPAKPPSEAFAPESQWIAVARLMRPQGRRGEILAEPLSDQQEIFSPGREFRLTASTTGARPCTLESSWQPQGRKAGLWVLKLTGCDSISDAELLEGSQLELRESDLPALADDTFLVRDLLGCILWDGDHALGTVVDLQFPIAADGRTRLPEAPDLLVIDPFPATELSPVEPPEVQSADAEPEVHDEGNLVLVPFVKAWLEEVDLPGKRLRMHLPPGLAH